MENGRITGYVRKHPEADQISLVGEFVCRYPLVLTSNVIAVGRGGWSPLPPLVQYNTRRLEGCKSVSFARLSELPFTPSNTKANILVGEDGRARLTDFGLASVARRDSSVVSLQDPDRGIGATWAAPEVLKGETVTREGDIFAFAMVVIEVCAGLCESSQMKFLNMSTPNRHSRDTPHL